MRGFRKVGEKMNLCRDCLLEKFLEALTNFHSKAVLIQTMAKRNAYQFYRFDQADLKPQWRRAQENIDALRSYLPSDSAFCKWCNTHAGFNWCSSVIYFDNPFGQRVNDSSMVEEEPLCEKHLLESFKKRLLELDITFAEFIPPVDTEGYCTSFDV
jgi:hypothetical protein